MCVPGLKVPSYLCQLAIPAPQTERGTNPVFTGVPIRLPPLSTNCTRILG